MPHFGLMDENKLGPVEGPLQRARLHIRGGKRRLRQGKIAAGIVTLYDALEGAMKSYVADPAKWAELTIHADENLNDERTLYAVLVRSRVLDGVFDYDSFDRLVETALHQELPGYDYRELLTRFETVMTRLGVMPFDEAALPPEDPATY
ncbi:MAG TPA: hypothetical protein VLG39_11285 [Nitrospirota bacterium]|nr:hypothetical protein [Nitrospirota bacterium]